MRDGYDEHPMNPLPPVVWLLALPIIATELFFAMGQSGLIGGAQAAGWRLDALQKFAFSPQVMRAMVQTGQYPPEQMMRILTYPFVNASVTQAIFVLVFLLALGKMVGEVFSGLAVAIVFFGATILGALVYAALPFTQIGLYGGYPGDYGLIGAFTWILWTRLGQENANQFRAFSLIGALMGIQLLFAMIFGARPDWIADIVGFVAGFVLSFFVAPGGMQRTLQRLRRR
ncbi:rhomboid family intramembrane serine protease [Thioclava nitratireducens]|uniref:Rhomboid family intramembrane serine protease n=1 Tax=Thioclava nitratireducens TaxID=1915078 RepID=A0ABM6IJW6_9RHOB|nr:MULTISPECIES: rhomboid family intramembrane serine protease [Thioclava]AQS49200.1 rhomboid family intramembrane serine protease [Thioclava nitratireducens]OWY03795.1 rhomboid family intramembrane serine protease [Thioclava sp. F1Mire-8]OWY14594.1 rhomboid family intramembrane serine protease [Thioclava sp. F34-6]PWE51630.1 rhomboid family intramembrane serine protease [Thioclava sp. NG1]